MTPWGVSRSLASAEFTASRRINPGKRGDQRMTTGFVVRKTGDTTAEVRHHLGTDQRMYGTKADRDEAVTTALTAYADYLRSGPRSKALVVTHVRKGDDQWLTVQEKADPVIGQTLRHAADRLEGLGAVQVADCLRLWAEKAEKGVAW